MFNQASTPVKIAVLVLAANWMIWFTISLAVGGTAIAGEISDGEFFVRRHPSSPLVAVSRDFWVFSLFYSMLTFGGTFLALALLYVFHRPARDRGVSDLVSVVFGALVLVFLLLNSWRSLSAWAAV